MTYTKPNVVSIDAIATSGNLRALAGSIAVPPAGYVWAENFEIRKSGPVTVVKPGFR